MDELERRILSLKFTLDKSSLMIMLLPSGALAADIVDSGTCGDNLVWTLDNEGTLIISGTGAMSDFTYGNRAPWYPKRQDIKVAKISEGVTTIGNQAFYSCDLARISIPSSVSHISDDAFFCYYLNEIAVDAANDYYSTQDGVLYNETMEELVYYPTGKSNSTFQIPNGVISIGNNAFRDCIELTNISIPNSVTTIGQNAFMYCRNLISINIPDSVTSIGESAFESSGLVSIKIPGSIEIIEDHLLDGCSSLESVTLGYGVKKIGFSAFHAYGDRGSHQTINIAIPPSVTEVDEYAFAFSIFSEVADWPSIVVYGTGGSYIQTFVWNYNHPGQHYFTFSNISNFAEGNPWPDVDPETPDNTSSVHFFSDWNPDNRYITLDEQTSPYYFADSIDSTVIDSLVGKYVLVTTSPDSLLEVISIQPVESKIGICSSVNGQTMTIDGVDYTVPEHWIIIDIYAGKEILYHVCDGALVGADIINEKEGVLQSYDSSAGTIVVDGKEYHTNFLTDVNSLNEIVQNIGKIVHFHATGISTTYPLLIDVMSYSVNPSALGKFILYADTPTTCIEKGKNFEIYVGYYKNDTLDSSVKDYICVVSDNSVFEATPNGWSNEHGQRYNISAKNTGYSTITITNPQNDDAVNLNVLCSVLAPFAVPFMDKNFLDKLIKHCDRHSIKSLVFVNQGDKLLGRLPALVIAGNGLFQLGDLTGKGILLFGILSVQSGITGIRQTAEDVILIDFAHEPFQFSGPFLRCCQPLFLLFDVAVLLVDLGFLHSEDKLGPVVPGIIGYGVERVGNKR